MAPSAPSAPLKKPQMLAVIFLAGAAAAAVSLAWSALQTGTTLAGCGADGGCARAAGSAYASVWGVPVAIPGTGAYLLTGLALLRGWRKTALLGSLVILGAALWFTLVQAVILRAWCPWCTLAHALAATAAIIILSSPGISPIRKPFLWRRILTGAGAAVLPAGVLAALQFTGNQASEASSPSSATLLEQATVTVGEKGELSLFHGRQTLDPRTLPVIGQRGFLSATQAVQNPLEALMAPQPVLVLSDWTCQHCRQLLARLMQLKTPAPATGPPVPPALAGAAESASFILLPAWREEEGRELHRMMLTAWVLSPETFGRLRDELISGRLPASPGKVSARLQEFMAGSGSWDVLLKQAEPRVGEMLRTGDLVLKESDNMLTEAVLPRLLLANGVLSGMPSDTDLAAFLQGGGNALASEAGDIRRQAVPNKSRIEFEATALETDPVLPGETARAVFHFRNTGTEPLNVIAVRTTCACAAVKGWKQTVPPAGRGSLSVEVDTAGHATSMTRQLTLVVNAGNAPQGGQIPLRITARILPLLPGKPASAAPASPPAGIPATAVPRRQVH